MSFVLAGYAVLEERDLPEDLEVAGAPYLGHPVITVEDDLSWLLQYMYITILMQIWCASPCRHVNTKCVENEQLYILLVLACCRLSSSPCSGSFAALVFFLGLFPYLIFNHNPLRARLYHLHSMSSRSKKEKKSLLFCDSGIQTQRWDYLKLMKYLTSLVNRLNSNVWSIHVTYFGRNRWNWNILRSIPNMQNR